MMPSTTPGNACPASILLKSLPDSYRPKRSLIQNSAVFKHNHMDSDLAICTNIEVTTLNFGSTVSTAKFRLTEL